VKYNEYSLSSWQPHPIQQEEWVGGDRRRRGGGDYSESQSGFGDDDSSDISEYSFEPDDSQVEGPEGRSRRNKWKSASSRQSHASNLPLPSWMGCPSSYPVKDSRISS